MKKLPITAFIASHNEAHLLAKCLENLNFCQEIVVCDLESEDPTTEEAQRLGVKVVDHELVPFIELLHDYFKEICKTEWMLLLDPDEVMQPGCGKYLEANFWRIHHGETGAINFPWFFYFKSHRLKGTHWGGNNSKTVLVRRASVEFTKRIHSGISLKAGYKFHDISFLEDQFIAHYWMTSYTKLFEKHRRYFRKTGQSQYESGKRTNLIGVLLAPFLGGLDSYFLKKGFKDGSVGIFLAIFYSWLHTGLQITLYSYQRRLGNQIGKKIENRKHHKTSVKNYIKNQLKVFIQEEVKRQLNKAGEINFIRQNAIRIRNLDYLYEALKWTKKPDFDKVPLVRCNDPMEVNGQKLKDMEVILGACVNMKDPHGTILEIGTADGVTTMRISQVAPEASIFTINIPEEEIDQGGTYVTFALPNDQIGINYKEAGCSNITQILANTLHWEPEMEHIDIAFVDGCHDADFVYQDTVKVLSKCQPGSIILWHDFNPDLVDKWDWIMDVCKGVNRLYAEGYLTKKMYHLQDSWVGIYVV